jgi:hypothetical protein
MQTVIAPRNPYAKLVTQFHAATPRVTPEGAWVAVHANLDAGFAQVYDGTEVAQWDFPAAEAVARGLVRSDYRSCIVFGALQLGEPRARLTVYDVYQLDEDVWWERRPYADRYAQLCDLFGGCDVQVQRLHAAAPTNGRARDWKAIAVAEPGDPAFEALIGESAPMLEQFLRRSMPNVKAEDAEDAAQEAVIKALRSYRGELSPPTPGRDFLPWIQKIAVNALKDIWKRGGQKKKEWEQRVFGGEILEREARRGRA